MVVKIVIKCVGRVGFSVLFGRFWLEFPDQAKCADCDWTVKEYHKEDSGILHRFTWHRELR